MTGVHDDSSLTMMLTQEDHLKAQYFYRKHSDPKKSKQVYLNTLAVQVVDRYLKYFGISADLEHSESWDLITQTLMDTAALTVPNIGEIECRPVLPDAISLHVPEEVWDDRLGYLAVQFDEQLETATLLGFTEKATAEDIPLRQLQPVESVLAVLEPQPNLLAHLSQWLDKAVETGWQTIDDFLHSPQPALNFRNTASTLSKIETDDGSVLRCRSLSLGDGNTANDLALIVGVKPSSSTELAIWVKIFPVGQQYLLPSDLELMLVDEAGKVVMQAQSRATESIGLRFRGDRGDRFSIQVKLASTTLLQDFVI